MQITINGDAKEISDSATISEVLKVSEVENPDLVSVQHNGEFVDKGDYATTQVKANDEIDFLYFMGGGQ